MFFHIESVRTSGIYQGSSYTQEMTKSSITKAGLIPEFIVVYLGQAH